MNHNYQSKHKKFYNSKEWLAARTAQLKAQPLCEEHLRLDELVPANCVDHKVGISDGGAMLDSDNLRSLCTSCHSRKTVREEGGLGKESSQYKPVKGCSADGLPIDPAHPWYRGG